MPTGTVRVTQALSEAELALSNAIRPAMPTSVLPADIASPSTIGAPTSNIASTSALATNTPKTVPEVVIAAKHQRRTTAASLVASGKRKAPDEDNQDSPELSNLRPGSVRRECKSAPAHAPCGNCTKKSFECLWALDNLGPCFMCQHSKVSCPGSAYRPRTTRHPGFPGKSTKRANSRRNASVDLSQDLASLSELRAANASLAGSSSVPPTSYLGPQASHSVEQLPDLVANISGTFVPKDDNLLGNLMNVMANTHLQLDGTLRAVLAIHQSLLAETRQSRVALVSIGQSLAAIASMYAGAVPSSEEHPSSAAKSKSTEVSRSPSPRQLPVPLEDGTERIRT